MKKHSSDSKSTTSMEEDKNNNWEVRPGGMLVQKRENDDESTSINIKVSHGSSLHQIHLPSHSTFGDLKGLLANVTGLEPKDQRLFFRGNEKADEECLHTVGVKERSKLLLMENIASKERKLEEMKKVEEISKACEPVNKVRIEVDKLAQKVSILESAMRNGTKVEDKEYALLTELLMVQLLKLDGIKADGEVKAQRRSEVRRVQSLVEALDNMKAGKLNTSNNNVNDPNTVSVPTKWEKVGSGFGSLDAPPPAPSSSEVNPDWESFD
ncbi:hypothetical protein ACHQM5_020701 [Ranunculus cassubicifolius]